MAVAEVDIGGPLPQHERPAQQVAEPLVVSGQDGREHGHRPERGPQLEHADDGPGGGLAHPHRPALDRDDPQAERGLAERAARPEALHGQRVADDDHQHHDQHDDDGDGAGSPTDRAGEGEGGHGQGAEHRDLDEHVEEDGGGAGADPGGARTRAARPTGVTMPLGCWRLTLHYRNGGVDIDRYIARNEAAWTRLAELTGRARRHVGRLSPGELDELIMLYQRTSTHLSYVRTYSTTRRWPPPRLTRLVADASGVIYGKRTRPASVR